MPAAPTLRRLSWLSSLTVVLALATGAARAADAGATATAIAPGAAAGAIAPASADAASSPARGSGRDSEPAIQRIVIDDDETRVEELRVRGVTKRITVRSKRGGSSYEILPADAGRGPPNTVESNGSAGGQRVWEILTF